ncbi:hypothetical protein [Arthrobacter sp. 2MCAF14]|uniref:hypothetical protein n=1 Tax=Arthrobacter sp. 2MCAF14 TaxID=3232982 RepID=UPI003F9288F8
MFLDFEAKVDALVAAAVQNEMHAAPSVGWRHITTGGHSWPKDLPTSTPNC